MLPAGAYEVITDEETIEGLAFSAYRRIATMIMVPAEGVRDSMEMLSIGSVDLVNAQVADASAANDWPAGRSQQAAWLRKKATDLRRALAEVEAM